jgi:hypothetical protein
MRGETVLKVRWNRRINSRRLTGNLETGINFTGNRVYQDMSPDPTNR